MDDNLYDIHQYTETQLYEILDINNPTDRELEAKIIQLIHKYNAMENETGIIFSEPINSKLGNSVIISQNGYRYIKIIGRISI